jgi:hypothetical protein
VLCRSDDVVRDWGKEVTDTRTIDYGCVAFEMPEIGGYGHQGATGLVLIPTSNKEAAKKVFEQWLQKHWSEKTGRSETEVSTMSFPTMTKRQRDIIQASPNIDPQTVDASNKVKPMVGKPQVLTIGLTKSVVSKYGNNWDKISDAFNHGELVYVKQGQDLYSGLQNVKIILYYIKPTKENQTPDDYLSKAELKFLKAAKTTLPKRIDNKHDPMLMVTNNNLADPVIPTQTGY